MKIGRLSVKGYRSLMDAEITFEGLNTLIGPNGSGKSSILGALNVLFSPSIVLDERDFWQAPDGSVVDEVTIGVTFEELPPAATEAFADFVADGELTLERHFNEAGRGEYLGYRAALPEFTPIRNLLKSHRDAYNELVAKGSFDGLERATTKDDAFEKMTAWEAAHPDLCQLAAVPVSFLSRSAGEPDAIATYLKFFFVGALEDPTRHLEAKGTGAVGELVREAVDMAQLEEQLEDIADEATRRGAQALTSLEDLFGAFHEATAGLLDQFAPGFKIELSLDELSPLAAPRLQIRASVRSEDGLSTDLAYQGQGVQRSLMYAVLTAQASLARPDISRTLCLAIEEPEAFQHPLSCRVLGRTLMDLTEKGYQLVYSTHSPDFVRPEAVTGIRLVTRVLQGQGPQSKVEAFDLQAFVEDFAVAVNNREITRESLAARLDANLERAVLEGLFARACVIVEGDEDEALIAGACAAVGVALDEVGIAIVQARGKSSMPLIVGFLLHAGIPTYPVFDLDRNLREEDQHRWAEHAIRQLVGQDVAAENLDGTTLGRDFACWMQNLGVTVDDEFGPEYVAIRNQVAEECGFTAQQAKKSAPVLREAVIRARGSGLTSPSLDALVLIVSKL